MDVRWQVHSHPPGLLSTRERVTAPPGPALSLKYVHRIESGAKVGLQVFTGKLIQQLISNNTKIHCVSGTHSCEPTFAPPCTEELSSQGYLRIFPGRHLGSAY